MANKRSIGEWVRQNIVTVIFIILCAACFILSGETPAYVAMELVNRLARNAFIVLSLIIPIVAGMGINFAITIGAMAAQIAILWVLEWQIPGIGGFLVAALMTIPIATLFGFLIGKLSTDTIISSIGDTLGRGTLTSIVLVMTVLPQLLVLGDALIERTAITLNRDRKQRFQNGTMRLDGHVRGHVSGFIDGEFKGVLHGSVDALIESKRQELDETEE